jgi:ATP-dependent RNA helicase DeaD
MHEPQTIRVQGTQRGDGQINHFHCIVHARDRYAALRRLADANPGVYGIVFCRTRAETQEVADHLIRDGYAADALHGDLSQAQRDHVMKRFRSKKIQMLVATDVAARGIDVDEITHVFHYQLPDEPESYTHRSGRTGRAGRSGSSIILLHMKETGKLRQLERMIGKAIPHLPVPSSNHVLQAQLRAFAERLLATPVDDPILKEHIPVVEKLLADLSNSDLLSRLVSMQLGRLIKDYSRAPDLNALIKGASGRGEVRESRHEMTGERHTFFISLGRMDNIEPSELLAICCDLLNTNRDHIGRIDLKHNFSFFQTIALNPDDVVKAFQEFTYKGRKIRMNLAETRDMEHTAGKRKSWEEKQGSSGSSNRSYSSKPNRSSKFSSLGRGERKSGESKSWGKSSWGKKSERSRRGEHSRPDSDGGNWRNLMTRKVDSGKKSADGKKKKW